MALAGLIYASLWLTANLLFARSPTPEPGDDSIVDWYLDEANQQSLVLALNLIVISAIAFLWFVAVIRRRVGERENRFFGTVFVGSALLLAATWIIAAALVATPALSPYLFGVAPEFTDIALFQAAGITVASVAGTRLSAVFMISTTTVGRMSETFPRYLVIGGYAVGLVLLLVPLPNEWLAWVFPAWVAVVSIEMLVKRRRIDGSGEAATD